MSPVGERPLALEVRGMSKSYGGAKALQDVSLAVRAGEVHALLGQNGCGKSTLVKSLTGVHSADEGTIHVFGDELTMPVIAPHTRGISVIHQDLGLVDSMTVLENLGINAGYGTKLLRPVDHHSETAIYEAILQRIDVRLDLKAEVSTLSPAERSLLAVVRAMRMMEMRSEDERANQVFILDEPTAALSGPEAETVLRLMRRVADGGAGVIFITHRLAEVMNVCDSLTIMRGGSVVRTSPVAAMTRMEIVAEMLGRKMDDFFPSPPESSDGDVRLAVSGLSGDRVTDLSFEVRAGEVLGITGLAGMGQEEIPHLLFGHTRATSGTVTIDGREASLSSPTAAIRAGLGLVPSNRLRDGCWLEGSAAENLTLPLLASRFGRFRIRGRGERRYAAQMLEDFQVHPRRSDLPMRAFSGGNQQKIVFAKWLQLDPGVLLLDEPTQGVDPGAAHDLLAKVMDVARGGTAVVVFSGDHEQLAQISHRVIVLSEGEIVAELVGAELTEQNLLHACHADVDEEQTAA